MFKNLCRGQFRLDASIDFDRVVFRNLRLTGGSLEAKRMTLGMLSSPRYVHQFDIHAHNCTLIEDDLFESSCIRNGLARLLVRILTNAGVATSKVQVTAVNIVVSLCWCCLVILMSLFQNPFHLHTCHSPPPLTRTYSPLERFLVLATQTLPLVLKCRLKFVLVSTFQAVAILSRFLVSRYHLVLLWVSLCQWYQRLTWTLVTMLDYEAFLWMVVVDASHSVPVRPSRRLIP